MKQTTKLICFLLAIVTYSFSYGQMKKYNYKRELKGISEQWQKITIPNELFEKTSQDLNDIRIFGITKSNDTIEAPYVLRLSAEKTANKNIVFKTLNASYNDKGYYFTFEVPTKETINQIELNFDNKNFDWRVTLEGSQDQKKWLTIVDDYRILSIKNEQTDFQFTKLDFPNSKYRFFRVRINSKEKPELTVANITQKTINEGLFRKHSVKKLEVIENKQTKQTEIDVELQLPVRISEIDIAISDTFDYYRPVTIQYITDSTKTEQGWKYSYRTLAKGTVTSIEENKFQFSSKTAKKLKIYIDNQNNKPLTIKSIVTKGYVYELIARFTDNATYYLTYGNKMARKPNYDIARFKENIPEKMTALNLGKELLIEKKEVSTTNPLFENKIWLWTIIIVIIASLGWFSLKMMNTKSAG